MSDMQHQESGLIGPPEPGHTPKPASGSGAVDGGRIAAEETFPREIEVGGGPNIVVHSQTEHDAFLNAARRNSENLREQADRAASRYAEKHAGEPRDVLARAMHEAYGKVLASADVCSWTDLEWGRSHMYLRVADVMLADGRVSAQEPSA